MHLTHQTPYAPLQAFGLVYCIADGEFIRFEKEKNKPGVCIFHSKMQFGVELALLRTPPPLLGGREEQVASSRDEKRDDALTVPLRLMQYICC